MLELEEPAAVREESASQSMVSDGGRLMAAGPPVACLRTAIEGIENPYLIARPALRLADEAEAPPREREELSDEAAEREVLVRPRPLAPLGELCNPFDAITFGIAVTMALIGIAVFASVLFVAIILTLQPR